MTDAKGVHRLIRDKFRVSIRNDNLPISSHRGTRETLLDVWREAGFLRVAEIGVNRGAFAREILSRLPAPAMYVGVDPWLPYEQWPSRTADERCDAYEAAKEAVREFGGRATLVRESSVDAVRSYNPGTFDAVFIDGDHTFDAVAVDIIQWSRLVRLGGIVACHDYYHFRNSGVVQAVDAYTHCHKIDPWYVTREREPTAFWVKP